MPKAAIKSRRVRATRKSARKPTAPKLPAPFSLNREGRAALEVHLQHEATSKAALAAGRPDASVASMKQTSAYMHALADRIEARGARTAADVVTLLIANLHSNRARHPLSGALDKVLGLGLTRELRP